MTVQEWLDCNDPDQMLECLQDRASERKLRLFAVACCRRIWTVVGNSCRYLGELTERYADGKVNQAALLVARDAAHNSDWTARGAFKEAAALADMAAAAGEAACNAATAAADAASDDPDYAERTPAWTAARQAEFVIQTVLLREIFGNPFHPATVETAWLTFNVVSLAQAIYDDRAFDRSS